MDEKMAQVDAKREKLAALCCANKANSDTLGNGDATLRQTVQQG